ncbi:MAG: DNA/RNA nuclease SfsA [Alphaproteobacteria bacterium]
MIFPTNLVPARLIRRYKRFLCDVALPDGGELTVHCPNPGSMMGLSEEGTEVFLSRSDNPGRKLSHTLELVRAARTLVGVNTGRTNAIAAEAIAAGSVPELAGYAGMRREVAYGQASRVDLVLEGGSGEAPLPGQGSLPTCYVEVKNVTLARSSGKGTRALFPDAATKRGAKHLRELAVLAAQGTRAVMFYVVQREDCGDFALAGDIDPAYARAFREARAAGVEAICYACKVGVEAIELDRPLPVRE